jgi:hypothetical protein
MPTRINDITIARTKMQVEIDTESVRATRVMLAI